MGRLVRDDIKATVTQVTTRYNQGMQSTPLLSLPQKIKAVLKAKGGPTFY